MGQGYVACGALYLGRYLAFSLLRESDPWPVAPLGRIAGREKGAILGQLDHKAATLTSALRRQGPDRTQGNRSENRATAAISGGPPGTRTLDSLIKSGVSVVPD